MANSDSMVKNATTRTFRELYERHVKKMKEDGICQIPEIERRSEREAVMTMQTNPMYYCLNKHKQLGAVRGIQVGDEFRYRGELVVIGLHHPLENDFDQLNMYGDPFATSIVLKDYTAHLGGFLVFKRKGQNLALKNSMDSNSQVRVILKQNEMFPYIYMGLYLVNYYAERQVPNGELEFECTLARVI